MQRLKLGISKEEEEKLKPQYARENLMLLMPTRDINNQVNWVDLSWFMPWTGWLPRQKGEWAVPQTLTMGNPFQVFYNAFVLNYDPIRGVIAKPYLTEEEQTATKWSYVTRSLGPDIVTKTPFDIIKATKEQPDIYGRKPELRKTLLERFLGFKYIKDITPFRKGILGRQKYEYGIGKKNIKRRFLSGEISKEKTTQLLQKRQEEYYKQKKEY